jgi:hypothetical protein
MIGDVNGAEFLAKALAVAGIDRDKLDTILLLVENELVRATAKHGPFTNTGVGLAAIVEEVGELAQALLKGEDDSRIQAEAVQVAAMGIRFIYDCVGGAG